MTPPLGSTPRTGHYTSMSGIEAIRTPDDRFTDLPGYAFAPNYFDDLPGYERLRLHYVDEGPRDAPVTFVCLHGQPTWSYLYRKMIPIFTAAGYRAIAPDLFGFGKSDKPVDDAVYTFDFHRNALKAFIERIGLQNVCLVVQDWGGILGLTLPHDYPEMITRMIVMNTGLGIGVSPGEGFLAWKAYNATRPDLAVGKLIKRGTPVLSDAEVAAYDAPFPDQTYKGGVRRFPDLVPISPEMDGVAVSRRAAKFLKDEWAGETYVAVGMQDPVLGPPVMKMLTSGIKGAPPPLEMPDAGHFVQEWGEPVARGALAHFKL